MRNQYTVILQYNDLKTTQKLLCIIKSVIALNLKCNKTFFQGVQKVRGCENCLLFENIGLSMFFNYFVTNDSISSFFFNFNFLTCFLNVLNIILIVLMTKSKNF